MDEDFEQGSSAIKKLTESIVNLMAANKEAEQAALDRAKADKEESERKRKEKETDDNYKNSKKQLTDAAKRLGSEFIKITDAGIKFAETIGVQATNGVRLELQNRMAAVKQILTLDANRAASLAQIQAAEKSLSDAFVGVREGLQFSADGAAKFANNLKGGFKSEFQLTTESLRALTVTGMSTTSQFDAFRRATGRANLSSSQFASIVNKNTLSFMLYGNKFAKAAADAEKLGINLASVQAAQEGLVTNLDGTIDTVAQLNQLGSQIDFGTLVRIAEQEGPDALLAYVRATVPDQLMMSTSTRALFKQLGVSVEDYKRMGSKQQEAANSIENQMSEAAKETGKLTGAATLLNKAYNTGIATFAGLVTALYLAIKALNIFSIYASKAGMPGGAAAGAAGKGLQALAGAGLGITGAQLGRSMVEQGNRGAGIATGAGLAALGTAIALAPFTGGMSLALLAAGGGIAGGIYAGMGKSPTPANDMFSTGYGSRMLVTPNGAFALNNADDIIAGTNLFPAGTLQAGGGSDSELVRKVDELISTISNANTTISVGGMSQTVPRMSLVTVQSRNERA